MSDGPIPTRIGITRPLLTSESVDGVTAGGDDLDWPSGPLGSAPSTKDQWKQPCRVATTASITIATALNNADTLDGVTLATGDRVLVKDQSTASQNGIYVVGTTPARAADMDDDDEVLGAIVEVLEGTIWGGSIWRNTNTTTPTIDTTTLAFVEVRQFSGLRVISPTQLAANTDNWNPTGLASAELIRASTDASRDLTGIVAPTITRVVVLANVGAFDLVLKHDATSTAANRFYCPNDADFTLAKDCGVYLVYDLTSSRWRVVTSPAGSGSTSFGTPAIVLGTAAAAGAASTAVRTDATIVAFDATAPTTQALGDAAAAGSAAVAARRDHKHAMPTAAVTTSGLTQATARLLGRTTASTGAIEEITVGTGLSLSAGSLTATGGSGGALVLLEQHTASSSATLDFTAWQSSSYDTYEIVFVDILPASASDLRLRLSINGGSSYDSTSGHYYTSAPGGSTGGIGGGGLGSSTYFGIYPFNGRNMKTSSSFRVGGALIFFQQSSGWAATGWLVGPDSAADIPQFLFPNLGFTQTSTVNALQFYMGSGNIASGTIRIYGFAK